MRLPAVGETFRGKYELRDVLGSGGTAAVFLAWDREIQRDVAIKILRPEDGAYSAHIADRFMHEARIISALQSDHTIRLFEFGERDGLLFMVFQYVAGQDLADVLQRGPLEPAVAVHITQQLLSALGEAHAQGVLHRDIKPANVLVHDYMGDPHTVKLLDFGVAKITRPDGPALTNTGIVLGTPRYMAPEQLFGEPLGPSTDLFGLGLCLYEMLVGRLPTDDLAEIVRQHGEDVPIRVPEHVAWPALRRVVERMTMREPSRRYASASDVSAALTQAMTAHVGPPRVSPPTVPMRPALEPQPQQSNRRAAAVAVAVGAVGLAGVLGWQSREAPTPVVVETRVPSALVAQRAAAPEPDVGVRDATTGATDVRIAAAVDAAPTDGCGVPIVGPPDDRTLHSERMSAQVHLPTGYDPDTRYPIIVGLQPKFLSPVQYGSDSGLHALTHREPVVVMLPRPVDQMEPWPDHDEQVVDIPILLDALEREYCVDRSRTFVMGHHDGAGLARRLMCEMELSGVLLSGWGLHRGVEWCEPKVPTPVLWVVGVKDDFIPPEGGESCTGGMYMSAEEFDATWLKRYGCGGAGRPWGKIPGGTCQTWACRDAEYVSCRSSGGHHLQRTDWSLAFPMCTRAPLRFDVATHGWAFFRHVGGARAQDR